MSIARDNPELVEVVMSEEDPIQEWARIVNTLHEVRKDTLRTLGHTEASLKELEARAISAMAGSEILKTQYGLVQLIPDKPVTWSPMRTLDATKQNTKRLKLIKGTT